MKLSRFLLVVFLLAFISNTNALAQIESSHFSYMDVFDLQFVAETNG